MLSKGRRQKTNPSRVMVITRYQPLTSKHLMLGLFIMLMMTLIGYSPATYPDNAYQSSAPFYQQLRQINPNRASNDQKSLLEQVMPKQALLEPLVETHDQQDDLAFNYLWLQQHQQGYKRRDGGAAAGKLIRMGLKSLYKSYSGSGTINTNYRDDADFKSNFSELDYRLRVSGDKVKLGVEYEF